MVAGSEIPVAEMIEHPLIGKTYTFPDGDRLEVIQIKRRNPDEYGEELWITFHAHSGPGIPRKNVMPLKEFIDNYGHLFP